MNKITRTVLDLQANDALSFFLEDSCYYKEALPPYISFNGLLNKINQFLAQKPNVLEKLTPENYENVNYVIATNKDGKYDWRPFELINPVLYVNLVRTITEQNNWQYINAQFGKFKCNSKIECMSIPIANTTTKENKSKQILSWWKNIEQKSIELSLDHEYVIETDITNCYGSLYTHSIAWALHGRETAKKNRQSTLFGNVIDKQIRAMQYGQTNGIPQGSILMDFIAEMVLGYIDEQLSAKLLSNKINDYHILRYRDDYKIFTNSPHTGEKILKILSEILLEVGMKINTLKTKTHDIIIASSIKKDKMSWLTKKQSNNNLQKHLLLIYQHALEFPHAGSLFEALQNYYYRLNGKINLKCNPRVLIAIVTDIAYKNPRTYPICAALLSLLLIQIQDTKDKIDLIEKIKNKFSRIPNTRSMLIWLQRISLFFASDIKYDEPLYTVIATTVKNNAEEKIKNNSNQQIWNMEWIEGKELRENDKKQLKTSLSKLKEMLEQNSIIDIDEYYKLSLKIELKEAALSLTRGY